jgi:RNA polymerase sigma factor (sigma-70 family)
LTPSDDLSVGSGEPARIERLDLIAALAGLSPRDRQALFLHYWADLSHEQIATALATPLGTVKLRVYRARTKLKPAVQPPAG